MVDQTTARFDADADLADIEDLPAFAVFHSGAILVTVDKQERKDIGDHDAWVATVKLKEWVEPTEEPGPGEKLASPGDIMDIAFMLDNEIGPGKMKEFLAPIKAKLGVTKTSECWTGCVGMDLLLIGNRKPKKDKDTKQIIPGEFVYQLKTTAVP